MKVARPAHGMIADPARTARRVRGCMACRACVLAVVITVATLAPHVAAPRPREAAILYRHWERRVKPGAAALTFRTMAADGSGDAWLADRPGYGHDFSPDGSRIVIAQGTQGANALEVMRSDGTARRQIPLPQGIRPLTPKWSPDGRQVAFVSAVDNRPHIFVIDIETEQLKDLSEAIGGELLFDSAPDWSPDGTRIVFESLRDREFWAEQPDPEKKRGTLTADLHMMTADGVYLGNITQSKDDETEPAWSPDGRFLACVWQPPRGSAPRLTLRDIATGREERLTDDDLGVSGPRWSPDGSRILFYAKIWRNRAEHTHNIYVVDRDGSNLTQLTDYLLPDGAGSPVWFDPGLAVSSAGKLPTGWGELKQRLPGR